MHLLLVLANHAFGAIAMAAHNLMRWSAIHDNPSRPSFAKGFRTKFIEIPGVVVKHARAIVLHIAETALKEVSRLREALGLKPLFPDLRGLSRGLDDFDL